MESAKLRLSVIKTNGESSSTQSHKLQRLKLEENLIMKCLNFTKEEQQFSEFSFNGVCGRYEEYIAEIKENYNQIRILFENITANATREDNIRVLDIEDMKRDVLEMEDKIKSFKLFLQSELTSLTQLEQKLENELSENTALSAKIKRKNLPAKQYNNVVPSPVKRIIQSPYKHAEVQEFQKFMKNSKNRNGGWIPYNHEIFVQFWQYFFSELDIFKINNVEELETYHQFRQNILQKLNGIGMEGIDEHSKWYLRFLQLKKKQQLALDRWRSKKDVIKNKNSCAQNSINKWTNESKIESLNSKNKKGSTRQGVNKKLSETELLQSDFLKSMANIELTTSDKLTEYDTAEYSDIVLKSIVSNKDGDDNKKQFGILTYLDPTAQWLHRCGEVKESKQFNFALEDIRKLRIPDWRIDLN